MSNGNFELEPLSADSATNTFPGWLEGTNGLAATDSPIAVTGNHSALIVKATGGDLHQDLTNSDAWQSDWIFEGDFACSNPGGGGARSFQLNLYHTSTANISVRVVDVEADGVGDVQLYNGSAFVTVLPDAVTFSSSPTNLNVNHIKIVGHYYSTAAPNYDVTMVSALHQTNSATHQTNWQASAPPANSSTRLTQVRFDTANIAPGTFEVLDNLKLTVAMVQTPRPIGIDVSDFQSSSLTWSTLKNTYGIKFGWAKATEGAGLAMANFTAYESRAKTAGVYIGAYHFARYDLDQGTDGATAEANFFWSIAKNYLKDGGYYLMPMLDVEADFSGYNRTTLSQWINQWCITVTNKAFAAGYIVKPCIYASSSHAAAMFDSTVTKWIPYMADWNGESPQTGAPTFAPWSKWTFWQYNDQNAAQAITTGDGDVYNGTLAELTEKMLITSVAVSLHWTGDGADPNWPSSANWEGGQPGSRADVLFDVTDGQPVFETNNIIVQNLTIHSLSYSNWTFGSPASNNFSQNTLIALGHTLTITDGLTVGVTSANGKGFTSDPLTYATISGTGGSLVVNGGDLNVGYQTSEAATLYVYARLDMSKLDNFSYNSVSNSFGIASAVHRCQGGDVFLAGTNSIAAAAITVGVGASGVATHAGALHLGQKNVLNNDTIVIGKDSEGDVDFRGGLTNPFVRIRGLDDSSGADSVYLGWTTSSGGTWGRGTNDFTAGTLDLQATDLFIALHAGDISGATQITSDSLLIGASSSNRIVVTNLTIGSNPGGLSANKTSQCTGVLDFQGGTLTADTVMIGSAANAGTGNGTLNLRGGVFNANTILLGATLSTNGVGSGLLALNSSSMFAGNIVAGGGFSGCAITNATLYLGGKIGSASNYLTSFTFANSHMTLGGAVGMGGCMFVDSFTIAGTNYLVITNQNLVVGQFSLINYHAFTSNGTLNLVVPSGVMAMLRDNPANQSVNLVVTAVPGQPIAPILGNCTVVSKDTYRVSGNGTADQLYSIYSTTEINLPINQWAVIGTATADTNGLIQFFNTSTNNQRFYRFGR